MRSPGRQPHAVYDDIARYGRLPEQLQAKLNLPGVPGLRDLPEVGIANRAVGVLELRMVQSVEELRPNLQLQRLP